MLVLHNAASVGTSSHRFAESDAGVPEEVQHVEAAMTRLGIEHRTVAVSRLRDLPDDLADGAEEVVFNPVEDWPDRNPDVSCVPAVCLAFGKESTGGDSQCLMLAEDKWRTRAVLGAARRGRLVACARLP